MMQPIETLWLALGAYWLLAARQSKATRRREARWLTWGRLALLAAAFEFVFSPWGRIGWLGWRFVPAGAVTYWLGVGLTAAGIAVAIWARHCLAANWSGAVTLKEGHELIRRGPYARVRHPIYAGIQLGMLGTAIAVGEWRALVAFGGLALAQALKARKEERWLASEFGAAFAEHSRQTGMFVPRLF